MKFPATLAELIAAGYQAAPVGHDRKLCSCGEIFLWFITPNKKWIPLSASGPDRLTPHHSVCKNVQDFRAADEKHKSCTEKPSPKQERLF